MNFEFSEEQELLREQARGFLQQNCPPAPFARRWTRKRGTTPN